jgi:hypothetical protein
VVWYVERAIKAKKTHTFNYVRTLRKYNKNIALNFVYYYI